MADQAKFTIVIPTRERCRYLEAALRTCLSQDYDNFEVIVSDNFSQDDTKQVVTSFRDDRIRYLNTGRRLSMSANWEFALEHVEEGYVMFLGDDDGLMPGGLGQVNEIVQATRCKVVKGGVAAYFWPDCPLKEMRNVLRAALGGEVRELKTAQTMEDVLAFRQPYQALPMLYYSFVHIDLVRRARKSSGRFFHSMTPDIYSGTAIGAVAEHHYHTTKPFVLGGASGASIGMAYVLRGSEHESEESKKAAQQYEQEDNLPFHERLVVCASAPILVAEAFLQARDHIPEARRFNIDLELVLRTAARQAVRALPACYRSVMDAIEEIGRRNDLAECASDLISTTTNKPRRTLRPAMGYRPTKKTITLDCGEFGVSDVYQASLLYRHAATFRDKDYFSLMGSLRTAWRELAGRAAARFSRSSRRPADE